MPYGIRTSRSRQKKSMQLILLFLISVFAICAALFLWRMGEALYVRIMRENAYDALIRDAGIRNKIDPALIKAVIWRESHFDRSTKGKKGEIGLMQIMPEYSVKDWAKAHRCRVPSKGALYEPSLNIEIGSWYLARSLYRFRHYRDQTALALCEYNAGAARALKWRPENPEDPVTERITIPSTRSYVQAILSRWEHYKKKVPVAK